MGGEDDLQRAGRAVLAAQLGGSSMKILKLRASVVLRAMLSPKVLILAVYISRNSLKFPWV
jgi:hypothetical protein